MSMFACTHANISSIPNMIDDKEIFTYQGRSNFGHQLKAADQKMMAFCENLNGGRPLLFDKKTQDLGYVVSADANGMSAMGNQNQIVRFSCEN